MHTGRATTGSESVARTLETLFRGSFRGAHEPPPQTFRRGVTPHAGVRVSRQNGGPKPGIRQHVATHGTGRLADGVRTEGLRQGRLFRASHVGPAQSRRPSREGEDGRAKGHWGGGRREAVGPGSALSPGRRSPQSRPPGRSPHAPRLQVSEARVTLPTQGTAGEAGVFCRSVCGDSCGSSET